MNDSQRGTFVPFKDLFFPTGKQPPPLVGDVQWDAQEFPDGRLQLYTHAPDDNGEVDDLTEMFEPGEWGKTNT